jgi:hypothetical protein
MVVLGALVPACVVTKGYGCSLESPLAVPEVHEVCLASRVPLEMFGISPIYPAIVELSWVTQQVQLESIMSVCAALSSLILLEALFASPIVATGTTTAELSSPAATEITLDSKIPSGCK